MTINISDLTGVAEPLKKLISVVSAGIGTIYRPRAIRKDAAAHADAVRVVADAASYTQVATARGAAQAELERIRVLAEGDPEIIERARFRLLAREVEGQLNVEAIAECALARLPENVSDQPVADDWRRKFFGEAENICDQDLQLLWGKVLAGEVTSPGSYSLRTLEVLKHISRMEAEYFRQACNLAFGDGNIFLPGNDLNEVLRPYGLTYDVILSLREAGLMHSGDNLHSRFRSEQSAKLITNNGVYVQLSGPSLAHMDLPVLAFTIAGRELQNLIDPCPSDAYLSAIATFLRARGVVVKKGSLTTPEPGVTVYSFEQDL